MDRVIDFESIDESSILSKCMYGLNSSAVEQKTENLWVRGSNPFLSTFKSTRFDKSIEKSATLFILYLYVQTFSSYIFKALLVGLNFKAFFVYRLGRYIFIVERQVQFL